MLETYTVGSLQESKNKAKHLDKLRSHLISNVWNWARWYQFIWGIAKRNEIPFETKHEVKRKSLIELSVIILLHPKPRAKYCDLCYFIAG